MLNQLSRWVAALLPLILCVPALRAQVWPKPNNPAPPLAISELLNAPKGETATWNSLRGKAVVLEFWATWCGGCVANIPHLNALAQKFKGQPIQFVSITDESEDVVARFLKEIPIDGWVALDSEDATFKAYGILGRPTTALIDSTGVLRAITGAVTSVNEDVLNSLIAGKAIGLHSPGAPPPPLGLEASAPSPLVQVLIRPAAPTNVSGYSPGSELTAGGRFDGWGLTLAEILSEAYDIPSQRIEGPEWCNETRYDLSVTVPHGEDSRRWPLVLQSLAATFDLQLERKPRETRVYVLRSISGQPLKLRASSSPKSSRWRQNGKYEFVSAKLAALTSVVQQRLGSPVFDETGLNGRYDFELTLTDTTAAAVEQAIRDQLGLDLIPSQRKLDYLVVRSAVEPRTW